MGYNKSKRPLWEYGQRWNVNRRFSSTATLLPRHGIVINSTANLKGKVFRLPKPGQGGIELTIINSQPQSSKGALKIQAGPTTVYNFFGSTNGTLTYTSGKKTGSIRLLSASSASWAIVAISTGITAGA